MASVLLRFGWSSATSGFSSERQFALTADSRNPDVAAFSASCVEDLRREGGRKRVRVNRHRPAKRSRPSVEKTLFTTTDFPSLSAGDSVLEDVVPPTTAPTAEPANAEVISTGVAAPSSVKSAPASLDFVRALVYGRKRKPLPTPPRAAAVLRVPSARAFRFARRAANSRPVAFAPKKIAPVKSSVIPMLAISEKQRTTDSVQTASVKNIMGPQPSVRPLVDLCRDKRRRITSLRNSSTSACRVSRRDVARSLRSVTGARISYSKPQLKQSIEEVASLLSQNPPGPGQVTVIPVYAEASSDLVTPVAAYLRLAYGEKNANVHSFLLESIAGGERLGRYSFLGTKPFRVVQSGGGQPTKDPLVELEFELSRVRFVPVKGLPSFTGGAVGYVTYDCVQYFEPRVKRELPDTIGLPESIYMYCDRIVVFDHLFQMLKVTSHLKVSAEEYPLSPEQLAQRYSSLHAEVNSVLAQITSDEIPQLPSPANPDRNSITVETNMNREAYEQVVRNLKEHIVDGDIIQAVPSRRVIRRTPVHPFAVYRKLRNLNPSPYMFYLDMGDHHLVGASPEALVKVESGWVETHPIAGTRMRGPSKEEDDRLERDLLEDEKERAEHIMLVDLGRNDLNRVCDPSTVKVTSLMHVERYSHVMHIVSVVRGKLRQGKTRFDAFRSVFPAGTVSGAPKVKAMEIIYDQEKQKRGLYAGSVGYFSYSGDLDTCIAIRTLVFKNGFAYSQAGAGIVYDSIPSSEFDETVNKAMGSMLAIERTEGALFGDN